MALYGISVQDGVASNVEAPLFQSKGRSGSPSSVLVGEGGFVHAVPGHTVCPYCIPYSLIQFCTRNAGLTLR